MAPKGGAAYEKTGVIVPGVAEGYRLPDHADRSYGGSVRAAYVAAGNRTAGVPDLLLSDCGRDCAYKKCGKVLPAAWDHGGAVGADLRLRAVWKPEYLAASECAVAASSGCGDAFPVGKGEAAG